MVDEMFVFLKLIRILSFFIGTCKELGTVVAKLGRCWSEPGIEGEEIAPLAKENIATP
ncbi:UNVERIFIED_CONTAM: Granule-bound starch synthase 1, chloroplastic/amyloplastic [Sesamum radiatum]|uniref:Granule-bound starch synthase 1, chloroplastic/amyloplastic n=1 Tax=Sesamum radiatum TaxID=300843 RepID=A0AAW2MFL7_SESRA